MTWIFEFDSTHEDVPLDQRADHWLLRCLEAARPVKQFDMPASGAEPDRQRLRDRQAGGWRLTNPNWPDCFAAILARPRPADEDGNDATTHLSVTSPGFTFRQIFLRYMEDGTEKTARLAAVGAPDGVYLLIPPRGLIRLTGDKAPDALGPLMRANGFGNSDGIRSFKARVILPEVSLLEPTKTFPADNITDKQVGRLARKMHGLLETGHVMLGESHYRDHSERLLQAILDLERDYRRNNHGQTVLRKFFVEAHNKEGERPIKCENWDDMFAAWDEIHGFLLTKARKEVEQQYGVKGNAANHLTPAGRIIHAMIDLGVEFYAFDANGGARDDATEAALFPVDVDRQAHRQVALEPIPARVRAIERRHEAGARAGDATSAEGMRRRNRNMARIFARFAGETGSLALNGAKHLWNSPLESGLKTLNSTKPHVPWRQHEYLQYMCGARNVILLYMDDYQTKFTP